MLKENELTPQRPLQDDGKRKILVSYAQKYNLPVFIETGTYMGGTAAHMAQVCREVHTIELSAYQYRICEHALKKLENVNLYMGDSAVTLAGVLSTINEPCLIWLDAHYSGGQTAYREKKTPMLAELDAIAAHRNDHTILIDDIRAYIEKSVYPDVTELAKRLTKLNPAYEIKIENDILRAELPCHE